MVWDEETLRIDMAETVGDGPPLSRHRKGEALHAHGSVPFALIESGAGGERISALTCAAQNLGLSEGDLLTDARALVPQLQTAPANSKRRKRT